MNMSSYPISVTLNGNLLIHEFTILERRGRYIVEGELLTTESP